jgi:hypothetical protein
VPKDPPKLPPNYFDVPPKLRAWYKSLGEVPPGFKQLGVDLRRFVQMTGQLPSRLRGMNDFIKRETRELAAEEAKLKARREQLEHQRATLDWELGADVPAPVERAPKAKPKLSLVKQTPSPEQVPPAASEDGEVEPRRPQQQVIAEIAPKVYPNGIPPTVGGSALSNTIARWLKNEAGKRWQKTKVEETGKAVEPPSPDSCDRFLKRHRGDV